MPEIPSPLRRLAAALLWATLGMALLAPVASASGTFGELGRYGKEGTGAGEFTLSTETAAFGVDPTDNSVYVVDEPNEKTGFRLQKFSSNKGEFKYVASVAVNPKGSDEAETIEGVAVDPAMHRVYLLVSGERSEGAGKIDPGDEVASELYAFSTEAKGTTLEPASGTEAGGLLAGTKVLRSDGNKYREALLEPHGIAVEPISSSEDNVIISGSVDTGEKNKSDVEIEHSSLLWVNSKGQLAGKQYTDETEALGDEAGSPVVYDKKVYVTAEEQIWEIPSGLVGAPKSFTWTTPQEQDFFEEQDLLEIPTLLAPEDGAGLSVSPTGTFWSTASIKLASAGNFFYPGAVEFSSSGSEIGWTGGGSAAAGETCAINFKGTPEEIAAGEEGDLFVLDTTPSKPKLIEFGPEGKGCPEDTATAPAASVNEKPVEPGQPIPINDTVTLASTVTQGNVLSVEWNFGDGTSETVSELEQCYLQVKAGESCALQDTEVDHKFAKSGALEVTETIHTDDLAAPVVVEHAKVLIQAGGPIVLTGEANPVGETTATLKGTVNPGGSQTTCVFEYGTSTSYGKTANCETEPGSGSNPVSVTANLTVLERKTIYHYKLLATNSESEKGEGSDRTFTTGPNPPTATTEAASAVSQTGATLNAKVDPNGATLTGCTFEYGPTSAYGSSVPCSSIPGAVKEAVAVSASVAGLNAASSYHYEIVVKTASEQITGSDRTFETEAPPVITPPVAKTPETPVGTSPSPGTGGVQSYTAATAEIKTSSTIAANGAFTLKIECAAGSGTCSGSITLKTLKAVLASVARGARAKAAILTLASSSFTIAAGSSKTVTLHLSAKGRALLAKAHVIAAKATIIARNAAGVSTTTTKTLSLKPAKKKKK